MKDIIVSYASKGREDYVSMSYALEDSLKGYEYRIYRNELPTPKGVKRYEHKQTPYGFKFTIIQQLIEEGYERIVWLDTSMRLVKNIFELFEQTPVIAFHNLGHDLAKYISDDAVKNLGNPDINIKQTWGGAIGFDFTKDKAKEVYNEIIEQIELGSFNDGNSTREGFVAHRHDQAVMSVLFHKHGIKLFDYGYIVCNIHAKYPYFYGDNYYLIYGK